MVMCYRLLWIQLTDKGLQKTNFIKQANLATNVMVDTGQNLVLPNRSNERICKSINRSFNDVFEFIYKEGEKNEADY